MEINKRLLLPKYIKATSCPGAAIEKVAEHAEELSNFYKCEVRFTFNGIHCIMPEGGDADKLTDAYFEQTNADRTARG